MFDRRSLLKKLIALPIAGKLVSNVTPITEGTKVIILSLNTIYDEKDIEIDWPSVKKTFQEAFAEAGLKKIPVVYLCGIKVDLVS